MKIVDDLKNNLTIFTIIKKIKQELCFKEKGVFKPWLNFTVRFSNRLSWPKNLPFGVYT